MTDTDLHVADRQLAGQVESSASRREFKVSQAIGLARGRWSNVAPSLRALKRHTGATDQEIADLLGLSRQTLQNRFSGKAAIAPWELEGLAAFFDVPVEVIFDGPDASVRWVLDHPSDLRLRNRCFAMSQYDDQLKLGA